LTTDGGSHCDTHSDFGIPGIQPVVSLNTDCDLYLNKNDTHALGAAIEAHPMAAQAIEEIAQKLGSWACEALAKSKWAALPCEIAAFLAVQYTVKVVLRAYHDGFCVKLRITWRDVPDPMLKDVRLGEERSEQFCR